MKSSKHFCNAPNCPNITANRYCAEHQYLQDEEDRKNHQPACIHCNSVKGHRNIQGKYKLTDGGD